MPRWQRAYVLATCALIAGAFAYAACDWGHWPRITYLPLYGRVTLHAPPGAMTITLPRIVAWGVGGAATGRSSVRCCVRSSKKPWPDRVLHLFGAWAITAILAGGLVLHLEPVAVVTL